MPPFNSGEIARFRPRTIRQFALFNIALRLDDLASLPHYLDSAISFPIDRLFEAARLAERRAFEDGSSPAGNFLSLLNTDGKEAA